VSVDSAHSLGGQSGVRPAAAGASASYVWYVVILLSVVNLFNYMDRMALSVLAPAIKSDLDLSDLELGLLAGFAFALFYAVCGIPIARWADRGIRRDIIALSLGVWSVMTALSGAAQNFWHLLLARVGLGVGEAGGVTPAQSLLCDYVPVTRRPGMFALHTFGLAAGMMLGMAFAGRLGETLGWRWTFVVLGLPGIVLALIIRLTLREPARGALDATRDEPVRISLGQALNTLWRCSTYRLLLLLSVLNVFVYAGLSQWWPSFYTRVHGLSMSSVGVSLGVANGAGYAAGLLIGGLLANKAAQRDMKLPLLVGALTAVLALPAALGMLFVHSASLSMLLAALTVLLHSVPFGAIIAAIYSVVSSRMRATTGALTAFCQSVVGFGLGPLFVGALSDALVPSFGSHSLRYALLAPVCLFPLMSLLLCGAARTLPEDLRAAGVQV
jgi:predicted MFS family arabinose efflux permease